MVANPTLPLQELDGSVDILASERNWPEVLDRIQTQSPEVAAALANLERARAAWMRATVEKRPNVTLDGLFNWRDNGIGGDSDGGITATIPLPIGDRNQGAIHQAAAEIGVAQRDMERLVLGLQDRLSPVYERYANAHYQVRQYRESILPDAQEALRLTRENYRAGNVDYDDLLTSQRTNAQVSLGYLSALRELFIADVEMEGFLLTGSLESR